MATKEKLSTKAGDFTVTIRTETGQLAHLCRRDFPWTVEGRLLWFEYRKIRDTERVRAQIQHVKGLVRQ